MKFPYGYEYLLVIDFEATCGKDGFSREEMEIIEIGAMKLNTSLEVVKEFNSFVKPVRRPVLTDFCKELTTISQTDVDNADYFTDVLMKFREDMKSEDALFASWGDYDKKQLLQDCKFHDVEYPFTEHHFNVKTYVAKKLNVKPISIEKVLGLLGLEFDGTPHRGIDDVRNIVRILEEIS